MCTCSFSSHQSQSLISLRWPQGNRRPISAGHACLGVFGALCSYFKTRFSPRRIPPGVAGRGAVYLQVTSQLLKLSLTRLSRAQKGPAVGRSACPASQQRNRLQDTSQGPVRGVAGQSVTAEFLGPLEFYLLPQDHGKYLNISKTP